MRPRRVVTDRRGGRSRAPYDSFNLGDHVGDEPAAVAANRARVAGELRVPENRLVWMNQVHGAEVAVVDGPHGSASEETTAPGNSLSAVALITFAAVQYCAVIVADRAGPAPGKRAGGGRSVAS